MQGISTYSIAHWNLGSKLWTNKINQIQLLVDTNKPDLLYISEANLDELIPDYENKIHGYIIYKPKTVSVNEVVRLIFLVRENLDVKIEALMDNVVTSIWVKVSEPGVRKVFVCRVYREHKYLNQESDWSLQPQEQLSRWKMFLRQVHCYP